MLTFPFQQNTNTQMPTICKHASCKTQASYGFRDGKPKYMYCKIHKEEGMILHSKGKRCEFSKCTKRIATQWWFSNITVLRNSCAFLALLPITMCLVFHVACLVLFAILNRTTIFAILGTFCTFRKFAPLPSGVENHALFFVYLTIHTRASPLFLEREREQ